MAMETESTPMGRRWTWREPNPARRLAVLLIMAVLLPAFGPGFLALGTAEVVVSCQRSEQLDCEADERFLFGLWHLKTGARGVTGMRAEEVGDEGATRLAFHTTTGTVPLSRWGSSTSGADQRQLARSLNAQVGAGGAAFTARQSFWSPFAPFGAVVTLVWLAGLWALITLPWRLARPQSVWVAARGRRVRVRTGAGGPLRELPPGDVVQVETTRNPGGPWGAFLAKPRTNDEGAVLVPPLHVALVLASGERLVLGNALALDDAQVRATAQGVAQAVGCHCLAREEEREAVAAMP